jgi:thymidylate synthase
MLNVKDIREAFADKLKDNDFVVDKTGVKTIELLGESFSAGKGFICDDDSIFGELNREYAEMELEWYRSQSLNVWDLPKTPKIWAQVSDKDGNINSNYGWCIFSEENGNQFKNVIRELRKNKDSRRASMIYTRPSMHTDYNKNGMSDFICTWGVDVEIRNNKLYLCVKMRSNDAWTGYRNDRYWHHFVMHELFTELKKTYPDLEKGVILWNSSSLHIYERQFYLVYHYIKTGERSITKKDFKEKYYRYIEEGIFTDTVDGKVVSFNV